MKVGITLSDHYGKFLTEIANLNGLSITSVCGLIVENFLSFNRSRKKFPLFRKQVMIVFEDEKSISSSCSSDSDCSDNFDTSDVQRRILSKEEILDELRENQVVDTELHDDDWLPF